MRVSSYAAAAAMFAFMSSAHAREMFTPNGPCLAFCDPAPTPTPSPTVQATADKKPDEPIILHRQRHRFVAASGVGKVRFWRQAHTDRASAAYVHMRAALAAAPHTLVATPHPVVSTPPASPAAVLAAPAPQIAASPSEVESAVAAASPVSNDPPTAEPRANPVEPDPDHSARLLAEAFTQQQQQAAAPAEPPKASPSRPESESALSPREAATVIPARSSGAVEVTLNGLHVTWWPENFPERAAIWSGALLLVAASAFSIARASSRRLQS
jgi:hypothetical protein